MFKKFYLDGVYRGRVLSCARALRNICACAYNNEVGVSKSAHARSFGSCTRARWRGRSPTHNIVVPRVRVRVQKRTGKRGKPIISSWQSAAMPNAAPDFFQHVLHLNPTR